LRTSPPQQSSKPTKEFLCETADRIRQRMTRTAQDIVEIGRELIAVKDRVGHGNFLPWIEREFRMSEDTAARFMNASGVLWRIAEASAPHPN
jgi:hypothetical protein